MNSFDEKALKLKKVIEESKKDTELNRELGDKTVKKLRDKALRDYLTVEYLRLKKKGDYWEPLKEVHTSE